MNSSRMCLNSCKNGADDARPPSSGRTPRLKGWGGWPGNHRLEGRALASSACTGGVHRLSPPGFAVVLWRRVKRLSPLGASRLNSIIARKSPLSEAGTITFIAARRQQHASKALARPNARRRRQYRSASDHTQLMQRCARSSRMWSETSKAQANTSKHSHDNSKALRAQGEQEEIKTRARSFRADAQDVTLRAADPDLRKPERSFLAARESAARIPRE